MTIHTNRSGTLQEKVKLCTTTEMHKELYVSIQDSVQEGMMVLNFETVGN